MLTIDEGEPEKLEQYKRLNTCEAKRQFIRSWAIKTIEEMVYKHEKAEETERKAKASRGEGRSMSVHSSAFALSNDSRRVGILGF